MGRPTIPDNWEELPLIPHDHVVKGTDVNLTLGPVVQQLARSFLGGSERLCTDVLQVFKTVLVPHLAIAYAANWGGRHLHLAIA